MSRRNALVATRQAPLREMYLERPKEAITIKRACTVERPSTDPLHGTVVATGYPEISWDYGIDAKVGGFDDLPNPGHLLCATLAACMDSTIRMIADFLAVPIHHLEVEVVGDVDVRGCLAMDEAVRSGFRQLRCDIRLQADPEADERLVKILLDHAERLCVTLDTLRDGVPVSVQTEVIPITSENI